MNEIQLKLCDIQGRLFELSVDRQLGSASFIKIFMNSETAKALDSTYNRMQWAGEEYLIEEVVAKKENAGDTAGYQGDLLIKIPEDMEVVGMMNTSYAFIFFIKPPWERYFILIICI